jgi:hypothetical protein
MVAASSSVKPLPLQSKYDSFLWSLIIVSSFLFGFGSDANKLGAVVVDVGGGGCAVVVGVFGSK